jgi:phage N-6-adenine-methyltransferase
MQLFDLELSLIATNGGTQPRASLDEGTIEEYALAMEQGEEFPSVQVFYDGETYWLADGFHRVAAAKKLGRLTIASVIHSGTRRDAVLFSVSANATHGLRRTNADKRRAVETLLNDEEWGNWSDREVARRCGVSNRFVTNLRNELSVNRSQIERTVTRNGTTYTQNTAKIGKSKPQSVEDETDEQALVLGLPASSYQVLPDVEHNHSSPYDVDDRPFTSTYFDPHGNPEDREDDHYTPEYIWRLALECFGVKEFDIDPCSNSHVSPNIPARNHFTKEDDGLSLPWKAKTLWMNPPYSETKLWVAKLLSEYRDGNINQAIALVKGDFSTRWFQPLLDFPICLVNHRIAFINPKNNGSGAKFASAVVYLGDNVKEFLNKFDSRCSISGIGIVTQSIRLPVNQTTLENDRNFASERGWTKGATCLQ